MQTKVQKKKPQTNLIVGQRASLTGVRPSRSGSTGRSSHSCVRGRQVEVVAVGGETNQQLLSWGTIALPVVHSVVLHMNEYRPGQCLFPNLIIISLQQEPSLTTLK